MEPRAPESQPALTGHWCPALTRTCTADVALNYTSAQINARWRFAACIDFRPLRPVECRTVSPRRLKAADGDGLAARVEALEQALRDVQREVKELRAAHDDAIDLALIGAVPTSVFRLIVDARDCGWTVSYRRNIHRGGCGTVCLEHPEGSVHDYSIDLPLPEDPAAQRSLESEVRMRIGRRRAA